MGETTRVNLSPIHSLGPSASGRARYSESDGYYRMHETDGSRYPCVCAPTCPAVCNAACGCFACRIAAADRKSAAALRLLREQQSASA